MSGEPQKSPEFTPQQMDAASRFDRGADTFAETASNLLAVLPDMKGRVFKGISESPEHHDPLGMIDQKLAHVEKVIAAMRATLGVTTRKES